MRFLLLVAALAGCDELFALDRLPEVPPPDAGMPGTWAQVTAGDGHVCGIRLDDTLWCWGQNDRGQLGLGATAGTIDVPAQVGAARWLSISTRDSTTCGIQADNTLWCWGANGNGGVGDGTSDDRFEPVNIPGAWRVVAAGDGHACAIADGGATSCWGANTYGQLGVGDYAIHQVPTPIKQPEPFETIVAGGNHTCALTSAGVAYCWGINYSGEVGNGTVGQTASIPMRVGPQRWASITAAGSHTCGHLIDGRLRCWGRNDTGQLGTDMVMWSENPIIVGEDRADWIAVAAGERHTCATRSDQTLWCWGSNSAGQLGGIPGGRFQPVPTQMRGGPRRWTRIAAGSGTTCGISDDHNLWCVGQGVNRGETVVLAPTQVTGEWTTVSSGTSSTCGIDAAGALWCWGANHHGQIGDETFTSRASPKLIDTGVWTSVDVGFNHACALRGDSVVHCWGHNLSSLGDGSTMRIAPTPIGDPQRFSRIGVGWYHSCAIEQSTNHLYCWGSGYSGQLGNGTYNAASLPTRVNTDAWTAVALGGNHTCGITAQGAKCWGANTTGQLGDGTQNTTTSPISIGMAMAIDLGDYFTCGLANTELRCWGYNFNGQLGDGTTTMRTMSVRVPGAYTAFSTGASHACAIATDGTLHCWGSNGAGQLGAGPLANSIMVPMQIGTETTWLSVSAGTKHTCATRTDRSLWCWGDNAYGQLGIGAAIAESVPMLVP